MKKIPRLVYEIRFKDDDWHCFAPDGEVILLCGRKSSLVEIAADRLIDAWNKLRVYSELVIKTKAGKIQDKRTYGEDPQRTKG